MQYAGVPYPIEADIPIAASPYAGGFGVPTAFPGAISPGIPGLPLGGLPFAGGVPFARLPFAAPITGLPFRAPVTGIPVGAAPFFGLPVSPFGLAPGALIPEAHPPMIRYRRGVPFLDIPFTHAPFIEVHY